MSIRSLQPRCECCGQSLAGGANSLATLPAENAALRERVARLEQEIADLTGGGYISSDTARKFHRADCEWADEIPSRNRKIYYSHADAVADGKKPCNTCCA